MPTNEPWPPNYTKIYKERVDRLTTIRASTLLKKGAFEYYRHHPHDFIEHWIDTFDPRNVGTDKPVRMPFIMFQRQRDLTDMLLYCIMNKKNGLIEKSRDMGATWICCSLSIWLWIYHDGSSIGWGSRKEDLVDKLGSMTSVFEKMRQIVRDLPDDFLPDDYTIAFMKITNGSNGSEIIGESGDNIGRGGRTTVYFKDESAHYERPELIEAALGDNTNVQIDISSVNGLGNVFHRKREAGQEWTGPDGDYSGSGSIVFVMDWSEHPAKTQAWYDARKAKAELEGLTAKFAQEVDRDYAASVTGAIIPAAWVRSAYDADKALGFDDSGGNVGGMDVADDGPDTNAFARRRGVCLKHVSEWGLPDAGASTRRVCGMCSTMKDPIKIQYDSIGVGAGVTSESNRLKSEGKLKRTITFHKWTASAKPLRPNKPVLGQTDKEAPKNKDFYTNIKAQGWWELRDRFRKVHEMRQGLAEYPHDELISIPSDLPLLRKLEKELCQATYSFNSSMKMVVDKSPPGTKSPNLADAVVMCYHPTDVKTPDSFVSGYT